MKKQHSLDELEYDICVDFGIDVDKHYEELSLRQVRVDFCKIIKIVEEGYLGYDRRWIWFDKDELSDVKVYDTIVFETNDDDKVAWFSKVDVDKVTKLNKELAKEDIDCNESEFFELLKGGCDILVVGVEFIKRIQKEKEEREAKEEEERKKEREAEEKEARRKDKQFQNYQQNSKFDSGKSSSLRVNEKSLTRDNNVLILKDKNFNEVVDYEMMKGLENYWKHIERDILPILILKQVDFDYDGVKIDFNPTKINGIKVRKDRIMPIVRALERDKSIDIGQYNTFSQMAIDLLKKKGFRVSNEEKIDVEFIALNKENWKVNIFGRTADLNWAEIKELFFYNGSSRSVCRLLERKDIFKLSRKIGMTKQELFDFVKKNRILNKLGEQDEE